MRFIDIRQLLDGLPDPVVLINSRRQVTVANTAALEVFPQIQPGRDLTWAIRHPDALDAVTRVLAGQSKLKTRMAETVPVARVFELSVSGFDGEDDDALPREPGAICHFRDVTALSEDERSRADFVANVSHELRSPLAGITGLIETLQGPARHDADATAHFLDIMAAESLRMSRLVEGLLSLSRVQMMEHVRPTETVNIEDLVIDVIRTLSPRARNSGVTIELGIDADVGAVIGNSDELIEVVHNLIDNALKYGAGDEPVRVRVGKGERDIGPVASISINNGGPVIADEHLPRLTERFYRVDSARTGSTGGSGLGLAIVQHIVNRHRGRLLIESSAEAGNSFTVFLPRHVELHESNTS